MSHELTLIVAATRNMGIGAKGGLPWTGLKKEMAYFARVTKRLPSQAPPDARNAVIMGRKTWESIPPKFRPLKGRLNIVISRSHPAWDPASAPAAAAMPDADKEPVKVGSLEQALAYLRADGVASRLGRVFVIGGAQIYDAALRAPEARRVLLTKPGLDAWVGEEVEGGEIEENGTKYEFQIWERA
ncbi:dihydrofolate reductase [Colletotrichum navitas]|uniref:Dihydrofolate reductase n=1 Tax=Colletotrichum navitas TaxID=681940 RepID=A0AAD8QBM2_9PEZI|nr:dihydrofolate reductase [Colletotrichum navitas]KAK1598692.1 dihydrofolate reductase [Colletotrichum navitas]